MPKSKIFLGNVCFIRHNGKLLLLCRNKKLMQGKWTGVGGKSEFSEEPLETCIREAKEETGLDIAPSLRGMVTTVNTADNSEWFLFVYTANKFSGELKECDEGKLEWVDEKHLYKKNLLEFIRKMLPYVLDTNEEILTGKLLHDNQGDLQSYVLRRGNKVLESK